MRTSWVEITAGMVLSCSQLEKIVYLRSMANESTESILQSARYVHHSNPFPSVSSEPRPRIRCGRHYTALKGILKTFIAIFQYILSQNAVRIHH